MLRPVPRFRPEAHAYYLGSHLGCGCGFFLESSLTPGGDDGEVELYVTWEGGHKAPPGKIIVGAEGLAKHLPLREGHIYLIGRGREPRNL